MLRKIHSQDSNYDEVEASIQAYLDSAKHTEKLFGANLDPYEWLECEWTKEGGYPLIYHVLSWL